MNRLLSAAAALLCAIGFTAMAPAQMTSVTAAANSLKMGGAVISTGTVTFTPVDVDGIPIAFATGGGGMNSPGAFNCAIAGGALSGCSVPDSALTNPPNLIYTIQISDTSTGNPTSGRAYTLQAVIGVSGTSWALDHYGPPARTSGIASIQASGGPADPTGACASPAIFTNTVSGALSDCAAGVWVAVGSVGGGSSFAISTFTGAQIVEIGTAIVNPVLNMTYSGTPTSATITNSDGINSPLTVASPFTSATLTGTFTQQVAHATTVTLTAAVGSASTQTKTLTLQSVPRAFAGVGTAGATGATASGNVATLVGATGTLGTVNLAASYVSATATFGAVSPNNQVVYVILTGANHNFKDANTGFGFPMTGTPITFVNGNGVTVPNTYLYQSNTVTGTIAIQVIS